MSNVITMENIDKFCDMLIDMQNSFSKDYAYIKPSKYKMKTVLNLLIQDSGGYTFYRRITEISNKLTNNLLSAKLQSKPDYIDNLMNLIRKTSDLEKILINFKKDDSEIIREKKFIILDFFYHTVLKFTVKDLYDLSLRFIKKKIISFESK